MYKLKINGYNAEFNGINKGTITINGVVYEWDNASQSYIINYDFSNEENVIAFQNAPVWSDGYTGEEGIYKRQDTQQMSWDIDSMKISPTGVRYGLYWTLPVEQATGKVTEEFQLWYEFSGITSKQTIGTIFHTYGGENGEVDRCRLEYIYDPNLSDGNYQWKWRQYTTLSDYTDVLISNNSERMNFKIEYDFDDTKTIKIYINNMLAYTDTTSIEACGMTYICFINNSISNNSSVKSNVIEHVYKVSVNN